jgi:pilus assembly protein Flp/PilA
MSISGFLQKICADERGATAIEYGLIVALIVIVIIASMSAFADATSGLWAIVRDRSAEAWG